MKLSQSAVTTMLPVTDVERAKTFYSDALGLTYLGTNASGEAAYELAGGSTLVLLPRPAGSHSDHTAMSFEVHGIESIVAEMTDRGVAFEDYDLPDLKTVDHVCVLGAEKAAWFRDPDGNYLCLHERTG